MTDKKRNEANLMSRACMVDALLRLIQKKTLSSVTISELTELAGVSRMTFYRNYQSKEEILIRHLDDILEDYQKEEVFFPDGGIYYDLPHLYHCFQYLAQYRDFLDGIFRCGFGNIFLEKISRYILNKWGKADGSNHFELLCFSGSLYTLYLNWVSENCRSSVSEMAGILNRIYAAADNHKSRA